MGKTFNMIGQFISQLSFNRYMFLHYCICVFDGWPLPFSVYLGGHWRYSLDEMDETFPSTTSDQKLDGENWEGLGTRLRSITFQCIAMESSENAATLYSTSTACLCSTTSTGNKLEAPELGTPCYKGQNVSSNGVRYGGVPLYVHKPNTRISHFIQVVQVDKMSNSTKTYLH